MTVRLAVIGDGKMGRAVATLARERGWEVTAVLGAADNPEGAGITRERLGDPEVAIEFTEPASAVANALGCVAAGIPVVVGTTGWYERLDDVRTAVGTSNGTLFWAANFSVGVHLFMRLAEEAGRRLRALPAFDAHVVETHHTAKKDAPSGTAVVLERALAETLGRDVPITSVRTGSVPGTHELLFDAPFEQIALTHVARDRRTFADGALHAARWLRGRHGVFTMSDMLSEEPS